MKKLLSLLGIIVLGGFVTDTLASCSNNKNENNKHKDEFKNSIWALLPSLTNKKINSQNIWNQLTNPFTNDVYGKNWNNNPSQWDGPTRIKTVMQLMQILSVSILANSDKLIPEGQQEFFNKIVDYKDIVTILKNQWKLLNDSVEQQIINKKQSFKKDYQKKWEEKYHDWLNDNYPNNIESSENKKYEIEENNYRASLMIQGGDNVSSASNILTNVLLNNNMRQYNVTSSTTVGKLLEKFNSWLKDEKLADEWNIENPGLRANLAVGYSWNNGKGGIIGNNTFDNNIQSVGYVKNKINDIATWLKAAEYDLNKFAKDYHPIDAPNFHTSSSDKLGVLTLNNQTFQPGMLSLFQKYMLEQWYQNEKPFAISQVIYSFKDSNSAFKSGIKPESFANNVQVDIEKDVNSLISTSWEKFYKNKSSSGIASSAQSLITLNSTDNEFKSNVVKANIYKNFNIKSTTAPHSIKDIIEKINRYDVNKMSAVWKLGELDNDKVIAFIDTDGLHLLHIDGNEFLLDSTEDSYSRYDLEWQLCSLGYSHNVYENDNYSALDDVIYDEKNKKYSKMNSQFQMANPYLQYLVNMSNAKKKDSSIRIQFDILKQVQSYAKTSTDPNDVLTVWWSWIYDFFNNFQTKILKVPNTDWLKSFIAFKNPDGTTSDMKWFENIVNAIKSTLVGDSYNKLASAIQIENNIINEYFNDELCGFFDIKEIINNVQFSKSKKLSGNIWLVKYKDY